MPDIPLRKVAGLPAKPGQMLLFDSEKQTLEALGWQAGDPIPQDLARKLHEEPPEDIGRRDVADRINELQNSGRAAFQMPAPVPVESLSPTKQAEYREYMRQAKAQAEQLNSMAGSLGKIDPSILAAMQQMANPGLPTQQEMPAQRQEEPEAEIAPEPATPTAEDKAAFLACTFADPPAPFIKTYTLFAGKLSLTLRDLDWDIEKRVKTRQTIHPSVDVNELRFAAALSDMRAENWHGDLPDDVDPYDRLLRLKSTGPLASPSVWWAAVRQCWEFFLLIERLEQAADEPNFWLATGN